MQIELSDLARRNLAAVLGTNSDHAISQFFGHVAENEEVLKALATEGHASDYVLTLIREDRQARGWLQERLSADAKSLEAAVLEGLDSGQPYEANSDFWQERRRRLNNAQRHR